MADPLTVKSYFINHDYATLCPDCLKIYDNIEVIKSGYYKRDFILSNYLYKATSCDTCGKESTKTINGWKNPTTTKVLISPIAYKNPMGAPCLIH